jgi:hypothetical protein
MVEIQGNGTLCYLTADVLARCGVEPRGVLHIGAHHGEEVPLYQGLGLSPIVLVEPQLQACAVIRELYGSAVRLIQGVVLSGGTVATLRTSQRSMASGTSPLVPDVVARMSAIPVHQARAIQREVPECNVLVVDTQGTELDVLLSADLDALDLVVAETDEAGRDASLHADVLALMAIAGWRPVERWRHGQHSYSDVAFVREVPRG